MTPCQAWSGMERLHITRGSSGAEQLLQGPRLKESKGERELECPRLP